MKRKITAAAAFALCVAMGVCACSPSEKEDTFTGKEKEELAWQPNLDRISPEVYADISNLDLKPGTYISVKNLSGETPPTSAGGRLSANAAMSAEASFVAQANNNKIKNAIRPDHHREFHDDNHTGM